MKGDATATVADKKKTTGSQQGADIPVASSLIRMMLYSLLQITPLKG